jgi:hypothetical protein
MTTDHNNMITIRSDEDTRDDFWRELRHMHAEGHFCDLTIVCAAGVTVRCHRLVVASVSSLFADLLADHECHGGDHDAVVHLRDYAGEEIRHVLDGVFGLAAKGGNWNAASRLDGLFDFKFDVDPLMSEPPVSDGEDDVALARTVKVSPSSRKRQRKDAGTTPSGSDVDEEELLSPKPARKRRNRKKPGPARSIPRFDDREDDARRAELYNTMKDSSAILSVRLLSERLDVYVVLPLSLVIYLNCPSPQPRPLQQEAPRGLLFPGPGGVIRDY